MINVHIKTKITREMPRKRGREGETRRWNRRKGRMFVQWRRKGKWSATRKEGGEREKGFSSWSQTETCPLCSWLGLPLFTPLAYFSGVYLVTAGNLETWHCRADRRGSCTNTLEFLRRTPFCSWTKSSYRTTTLSLHYTFLIYTVS